jgi:histidinol-phosphate aminotransferase
MKSIKDMTKTVFDINALVRKNILQMKPYSSARDEFKGDAEVFLDANENPYPSPYNRYPDPLQWKIKEKLAVIKEVNPKQIFLGNGSDEPIDLLIRAFCEPGKHSILITEPTYGMYAVCAEVNDVRIKSVLLTAEYDLDIDGTLGAIDNNTRIIFLCSPNNPSAALLTREKIIKVVQEFNGIVVVDEAYIDFAKTKSFVKELNEFPNLVVLQTFSKAWGLAGLRCGMAYASENIINILNKIKYPYNINIQTQELIYDALGKEAQKNQWVHEILEQREKFVASLTELTIVKQVFPTDANFVLTRVSDARTIYQYLMERKIIVRDRSKVRLCENCLRITIGTPEENKILIEALKDYR